MHLISKNIVVESGIRDEIFWIRAMSCTFSIRVRVGVDVLGVRLHSTSRVRVKVSVCGYAYN